MGAFVAGVGSLAARVAKLERPSLHDQRGGFLVLPPRLNHDAWERLAMASQARLAADTRDGLEEAPHVRITTEPAPALDAPWWQGQQQ